MKKKVLFLCTGNSCRSQMAEAFLRVKAPDKFEAFSAGVNPTFINSSTIEVMSEIGIDISGQYSKSVNEYLDKDFEYVVTVCDNAKKICPVFYAKHKKIHWNLPDPAQIQGTREKRLEAFRRVRDKIEEKITQFIKLYKS